MSGLNDDMICGLIRSVGPETAHDLICFFLEESRDRLHIMADLAGTDRLADLAREAHSLKSAAFTYGADTLGELARTLERACRSADVDAILSSYQALADNAGAHLDGLEARAAILVKEDRNA